MATDQSIDHGLRNFAVLHHSGVDEPHYDFMFDTSDQSNLITFRVKQWPILENQFATKLRDHRRAYLTLQGEIPGGRGTILRVDEGKLHVMQNGSGWVLKHEDGRAWIALEPDSEPSPGNESQWWITKS